MKRNKLREALDLLRHALEVKYRFIVHYPRLTRMMPDQELASKLETLGRDSTRHADIVSRTISRLGGIAPVPTVDLLPEPLDFKDFFRKQLELEKLALWLHTKASESVGEELAPSLREIAEQERWHIRLTEEIISRLG